MSTYAMTQKEQLGLAGIYTNLAIGGVMKNFIAFSDFILML